MVLERLLLGSGFKMVPEWCGEEGVESQGPHDTNVTRREQKRVPMNEGGLGQT